MNVWLAILLIFIAGLGSLIFGILIGYAVGVESAAKEYSKVIKLLGAKNDLLKALEEEGLLEK